MGAVPLHLVRIKKRQSFFKLWCKRFYALHKLRRESQERRLEPNILTWCVGFRPFFPQSLPRFHPSDRAAAPSERTYTLQCRSASGIRTPFLCTHANPARAVFLNMPIFICKLIMNLLSDFVNIFTQKIVKTARTEAYRTVLILSTHFHFRAHGARAKRDL